MSAAFDKEASDALVAACARISSLASTAVEEATGASMPFMTFAQRSRIRALATRFDYQTGESVVVAAPAVRAVEAMSGGGLTREEVDAIVAHRVQIAVTEALKSLGVSPDTSLEHQIERKVDAHAGTLEHRLLDSMRRHLTDSLEMLETSLDERIADFVEGTAPKAAPIAEDRGVEAQLEEARENLLKNIDEVRTIDVGFDIGEFAASIVEVDRVSGAHNSAAIEAALSAAEDLEFGDEDAEIEAGGDELEASTEAVEVGGDELEASTQTVGGGDEGGDEGGEELELELASISPSEVVADSAQRTAGADEAAPTLGDELAGDAAEVDLEALEADEGARDVAPVEFDLTEGVGDSIEVALGAEDGAPIVESGASVDLDATDPQDDLEEISVVQAMPAAPAEALDLDVDIADADDVSLMTLGEGPDEIRVGDLDAEEAILSEDEVEVAVEDDLDLEVDQPRPGEDDAAIVRKYFDKAQQMSARQQHTPAMELYSKVLDLEPGHFDALISRGTIYMRTKDYRRATEDFRRAQTVAPERAGSHFGLAELHYNRRQFNKAIKNYNLALERDDLLAEAYCRRGLSYYYLKNYKAAFADLYRAYDIDPELPKIKSFLKLVQNKIKEGGA